MDDSPTTCDAVDLTAAQALATLMPPERMAQAMRSRVVVRSDIIFQVPNRPTRVWGTPHAFDVTSDEQPYERWQPVGEQWVKLNLSWIDNPSVVYLHNPSPSFAVQPTEQQQKDADDRVVEVSVGVEDDPFALIRPGRDCHLEIIGNIGIRCQRGNVKLLVVALPS